MNNIKETIFVSLLDPLSKGIKDETSTLGQEENLGVFKNIYIENEKVFTVFARFGSQKSNYLLEK